MASQRDKEKRWQFGLGTFLVAMLLIPLPFAFITRDTTGYDGWWSSVLGWALLAPCIGGTVGYLLYRQWGAFVGIFATGYCASEAYLLVYPGPYAGTLSQITRYSQAPQMIFRGAVVLSVVVLVWAVLKRFTLAKS